MVIWTTVGPSYITVLKIGLINRDLERSKDMSDQYRLKMVHEKKVSEIDRCILVRVAWYNGLSLPTIKEVL